jgi:hypothetical protein
MIRFFFFYSRPCTQHRAPDKYEPPLPLIHPAATIPISSAQCTSPPRNNKLGYRVLTAVCESINFFQVHTLRIRTAALRTRSMIDGVSLTFFSSVYASNGCAANPVHNRGSFVIREIEFRQSAEKTRYSSHDFSRHVHLRPIDD